VSGAALGRGTQLVVDPGAAKTIKLIGLGGVGGIVARYATTFLAASLSPTRLVLIDGDEFEPRNAERMLFSNCGNKAVVVRDDLLPFVEESPLTLVAVSEYVSDGNLERLVGEGDLVVLAVDNHATRKLVADHCRALEDSCLISGGNDGVGDDSSGRPQRGTCGNVQIQIRCEGRDATPPLFAYHPEIAEPADALPTDESCTEALVRVPQILFANLLTASAILNSFYLYLCGALHYPEVCFDLAEGRMQPLDLPWPQPGQRTASRDLEDPLTS
jgi:hypothetical protein